jgi:transcriptional/translational regulatory protein YebC/TACO1
VLTGCRNRFSSVDVEDVDEADLSSAHVALAARPDNKQVDTVDVFELEAEQAFDNAFSVFCYFEDLHRLQKRLVESWKECKAGEVSLVPTAATTHTDRPSRRN